MNVCFDFCYKFSETLLIVRKTERDMIKKFIRLHIKYRYSCQISWNFNFMDRFSKDTQIPNFVKIRPLGAELFHADGQTGVIKILVAFRNCANAPNNYPVVRVPSVAPSPETGLSLPCLSCSVLPRVQRIVAQVPWSFSSAVRKSHTAITTATVNVRWEARHGIMAANVSRQTQKVVTQRHLVTYHKATLLAIVCLSSELHAFFFQISTADSGRRPHHYQRFTITLN
jgi:hypothetical protein